VNKILPVVTCNKSMKYYFITCPKCESMAQMMESDITKKKGIIVCQANHRMKKCGCKFQVLLTEDRYSKTKEIVEVMGTHSITLGAIIMELERLGGIHYGKKR